MTKNIILDFLQQHKEELSKKYGVTKIGLFGSYARDEQRDDSDIEIKSSNKFRSFFGLKYFIEEHLHKNIDLGIESTLKPIAKESIQREIIYV